MPSTPLPEHPRASSAHIPALDGLRGLAIFLVVLHHLIESKTYSTSRLLEFFIDVKGAGWIGVDLFFVLSGFLITGILVDTLDHPHFFRNFYGRRILRIFPLYYGVLTAFFVYLAATHAHFLSQFGLIAVYLQNTPLWFKYSETTVLTHALGHFWSLAVEEQFYLVWPLLIFLLRDRRLLAVAGFTLVLLAPLSRILLFETGSTLETLYKLTICRADSLAWGGLLALGMRSLYRERILRFATPVFWLGLLLSFALAFLTGSFDWMTNSYVDRYGISFVALTFAAVLALTLRPGGTASSFFRAPFLRFFGKYSYGIYVFHQIVAYLLGLRFRGFLEAHLHSKGLLHGTWFLCIVAITIPLAMLSYKFFEMRFLVLKRHFDYANA